MPDAAGVSHSKYEPNIGNRIVQQKVAMIQQSILKYQGEFPKQRQNMEGFQKRKNGYKLTTNS